MKKNYFTNYLNKFSKNNYFLKENNNKGKKRIKPYLNPTMAENKIEPKNNTKEIIKNLFFINRYIWL